MLIDAEEAAMAWQRRGAPQGALWRGRDLVEGLRAVSLAQDVDPVVMLVPASKVSSPSSLRGARVAAGRDRFAALFVVAVTALVGSLAFQPASDGAADVLRDPRAGEHRGPSEREADAVREAAGAALERATSSTPEQRRMHRSRYTTIPRTR